MADTTAGILATVGFAVLAGAGMWGMWRLGDRFVAWSVAQYGPLDRQGDDTETPADEGRACVPHDTDIPDRH